jgi:hypothetical protein
LWYFFLGKLLELLCRRIIVVAIVVVVVVSLIFPNVDELISVEKFGTICPDN